MVDHPFEAIYIRYIYIYIFEDISSDISSPHFKLIERFTVISYDRTSTGDSVNKVRRELFSQKDHSLENLLPTQDALLQHVLRVAHQSGIWTNSVVSDFEIPSPDDW